MNVKRERIISIFLQMKIKDQNRCRNIEKKNNFYQREEAVRRIVERDGKTVEEAQKRLDNQMDNSKRCQVKR